MAQYVRVIRALRLGTKMKLKKRSVLFVFCPRRVVVNNDGPHTHHITI
jgi:hypothetical protein